MRRRGWLHLLWVMPVPLAIACGLLLVADISVCGVSGCTGGGFGVSRDTSTTVLALLGAVLVTAVPAMLVPWHPRTTVRVTGSCVAALVLVGGAFAVLRAIA